MKVKDHNNVRIPLNGVIISAMLFILFGTAMELYLLGHYEDFYQLIPLVCIGSALLVFVILFFKRAIWVMRLFKIIIVLTALSGIYGIGLHLQANYEFEQELRPTASVWNLLAESLSGALPTLAPGSMIVLALIGYSYTILLKQKL